MNIREYEALTPNPYDQEFVPMESQLTIEDWLALPDTKPRYELIDGRLVQKPLDTIVANADDPVPADALLTVEDWVKLGDVKPPYELIAGKLVQKMVNSGKHSWATTQFSSICVVWAYATGWLFFQEGPGLRFGGQEGYVPDLMGYPPDATIDLSSSYYKNKPPFVAAEVLSPATAHIDRTHKKEVYARGGVKLYLLIDVDAHTLEVYRLENGVYGEPEVLRDNDVWQPPELSGLRVELAHLWRK